MITGITKLLGVIGHPVEHSLSPIMHNAAICAMANANLIASSELNYVYLPFPVHPDDLQQAIAGFAAIGLQGFNVTIPHKQRIVPLLAEVSAIAQAVGAVNTVCRTENGWSGTNTDVVGFLAPLQAMERDWTQATAVILGNGGAARAAVVGCAQLGCCKVQVVGRDPEKLKTFLHSWMGSPFAVDLSIHRWEEVEALLPEADLLVNTTPIGMSPRVQDSPLSQTNAQKISRGAIAYDLIYTPNPTRFLQQAQAQGAIALDGLEMLIQQGAAALHLWLKQPIPVEVMRQSLKQHLRLSH